MGISVEDAVKELQARETVFVAYSQATKLPYVTCGEETYNDQVWFFAEEETLKEYGKKKLEDKILLQRKELKNLEKNFWMIRSSLWVCVMRKKIFRECTDFCFLLA